MDQLTRYGKAAALGTGVLLAVLGASVAVEASPVLPALGPAAGCCDTLETFTGEVQITRNCCGAETSPDHDLMTLHFVGSDFCHPGKAVHFVSECDAVIDCLPEVNSGATCSCPIPFTFTAEIPNVDLCDTWVVTLRKVGFCGDAPGNISCCPFTSDCTGSFEFIPSTSQVVVPPTDFAFFDPDPTGAKGVIISVMGAPEVDGNKVVSPLAVLLGTLLVWSDPRRRRSEES